MKATLIQMDIAWNNPRENISRASKAVAANPGSDLYVLPEMWSTGFATEPEGIAEEEENSSLEWMKETASRTGAAIAGSLAVRCSDSSFRNRFYFVKPDGEVSHYDKHHLFTYSGEHLRYKAGERKVTVEWKGVRFRMAVCYDLRFPLWTRNKEDYDALLVTASWPDSRIEAWRTLVKARAIENQCYVLAVNRTGEDPSCSYCGGTAFVDPYGRAEECAEGKACALTSEIDLELLREYRQKFPVLKDRDDF
ncbi:MAG: nitrilase-related carbon-nitrogen hydrolase [Candidatus Cryptobacteroides sp.]